MRTYISIGITLLPTILLCLPSCTHFRNFQSLCILICSHTHLAITPEAGTTFVGRITSFAISSPVSVFTSIKNPFELCSSFNIIASEWQQLYKIFSDMGAIIPVPFAYNSIHISCKVSSPILYMNIHVWKYGSFRPLFLLIISISSSQCLTTIYEAMCHLGDWIILQHVDSQPIATINVFIRNSGWLGYVILPTHSPKSIAGLLLTCLPCFLNFQIWHIHIFKTIYKNCTNIDSAILKISDGTQFLNVAKQSATAVSQYRGSSQISCLMFCCLIMYWCFVWKNPATHIFFHLWNALQLVCLILVAKYLKKNLVWLRLIGGSSAALSKSDKSLLSSLPS